MPTPPTTDLKTPIGAIRDPKTGGLLTLANKATAERADLQPVEPKRAGFTLPPWVSTLLGVLAFVAAAPAAIVATLSTGGLAVPAFLITAAAIGTPAAGLLTAGAFWAAGGDPLVALRKQGLVMVPPPGSSSPSDGAAGPRTGPPEP